MNKMKKFLLSFVAIFAMIFILSSCGGAPEYTVNYHVDKSIYSTAKVTEGNQATKPEDPKKDYHTFDNWCLDENLNDVYNFNNPVKKDLDLYARFNSIKYTMSFNSNGGNDVESKKVDANTTVNNLPIPVKNRFEFKGWYTNAELTNPFDYSTKILSDMTLYAKWQEKYFKILFNPDNDTAGFEQLVEGNTLATKPASPEKIGYAFVGWVKNDGEEFDFNTPITSNMTLKASYIKDTDAYFVVSFETNGGSTVPAKVAYMGSTIGLPLSIKDNCILAGWYLDEEFTQEFTSSTAINSNITLYAKWKEPEVNKYYKVTFDPNNESQAFVENVEANTIAIRPANPTRDGMVFVNWIKEDGMVFDFNTPITSDIKLTAAYVDDSQVQYVVSFEANGGSTVPAIVVTPGATISLPLSIKDGYILVGWYTDELFEHEFTVATQINKSMTLYAKWRTPVPDETFYKVTFDPNNETQAFVENVEANTIAIRPANPTRDGMVFVNWIKEDGMVFDFNTPITSDIKLTAAYVEDSQVQYVVSFEANGGSTVPAMVVTPGATISLPLSVKDGYILVGWYADELFENEFTATSTVNKNITLYAKWRYPVPEETYYRVIFDPNNGAQAFTEIIEEGKTAIKPINPTKDGYSFASWKTDDGKVFDFSTPITSDVRLTAAYEEVVKIEYVVSFEANGGSSVPAMVVTPGATISLPLSVKDGFILSGWYTDELFENEFTVTTPINKNITLYAKWRTPALDETYYTVTFDPNNGSQAFTETIEAGKTAIKPANPAKEGYAFVNWLREDGTVFSFNTPINENVNLQASYVVVDNTQYVVSFESNGGSSVAAMVVKPGTTIVLPLSNKENYILEGWFTDQAFTTEFTNQTVVDSNIMLYAKWKYVTTDSYYTITFDPDNGSEVFAETVEKNKKAIMPKDPEKEGYTFVYWANGDKPFSFNELITSNYNLVAKWRVDEAEDKVFIVSFACFGGTEINNVEVEDGKLIRMPEPPYMEGYQFAGWYTDLDLTVPFDETKPITADLTLFASWALIEGPKYNVTFYDSDGTAIRVKIAEGVYTYTQEVAEGSDAIPPADPQKEGYRFDGWSTEFNNVHSDLEVKATYVRAYNVYFYDYNRTLLKYELVDFGNSAVEPEVPERYGYRFTGWNKEFDYITQDTIIQSTYIKQYEIKFRDYNGDLISRTWYDEGAQIIAPAVPEVTIEDKEFNGWDQEFDKAIKDVTIRMTLRTKTYIVRFIDIDNTVLSTNLIYIGKSAEAPDMTDKIYIDWKGTEKAAYRFNSWDKAFDNITANLDVIAQYDKITEPLIYVDTTKISQGQEKVEVSVYLIYDSSFEALHLNLKYSDNIEIKESSIALKGQFNRGSQSNVTLDPHTRTCSFNCIDTSGFDLNGNYSEIMRITIELDKYSTVGLYPISVIDGSYLTNNGVVKILPVVINGGVVIE